MCNIAILSQEQANLCTLLCEGHCGLTKGSGVVGCRGTISNIEITRSEVLQQHDVFYA
jgi:hypothetical protein